MAGMWLVDEDLPREINRVTLDLVVKDANGMPVASVHCFELLREPIVARCFE